MEAVLDLPTGRLIVADPAELFGDATPLDLDLPPGRHPAATVPGGLELRLGDGVPVRWTEAAPGFDTPSGHVCLLDADALEQFTDLGDEPVDEYELLAELLRGHPARPVEFSGLLVFPAGRAVRALRAGYDADGRLSRIVLEL